MTDFLLHQLLPSFHDLIGHPHVRDLFNGDGRVEVAIWRNVKDDGEGGERISLSATVNRSYFDAGREEWKRTNVLFLADLLPAAFLLQRVAEKIADMQT